jgi:hypothetical protein
MLEGEKQRSVAQTWAVHSIQRVWHNAACLTLANRANTIRRMEQRQKTAPITTPALVRLIPAFSVLFNAADLASFLTKLGRLSEPDAHRVGHARDASKRIERS